MSMNKELQEAIEACRKYQNCQTEIIPFDELDLVIIHAERAVELERENRKLINKLTMAQYAEIQDMLRNDIKELKEENQQLRERAAELEKELAWSSTVINDYRNKYGDDRFGEDTTRTELERLKKQTTWQTIDSAPRDGRILGCQDGEVFEIIWGETWSNDGALGWTDNYESLNEYNPTHWQPLPPAPSIAKEEV